MGGLIAFRGEVLYFSSTIWRSSLDTILEWWVNQCRSDREEYFRRTSLKHSSHESKQAPGLSFHGVHLHLIFMPVLDYDPEVLCHHHLGELNMSTVLVRDQHRQ